MNIHEEIELQDCPYCGGPGLLEEENDMCWYVACLDCGAQTAPFFFQKATQRLEAARKVATLWNIGKVIKPDNGD